MDLANTATPADAREDGGLDNTTTQILLWIMNTVICQVIQLFGIVTNVFNIICFVKQGFRDPINISLLGLAVSDLGSLTTLVWINITFTPAFAEADLPFDPMDVYFLVGGIPHATFSRISCWITAMITVERCLCTISPLKTQLKVSLHQTYSDGTSPIHIEINDNSVKVKRIVTPKRVGILNVAIFIILITAGTPVYLVHKLDMKFFPGKNKSIVGLISSPNREKVEGIYFALNNFLLQFIAFMVIIVCTVVLVFSLNRRTQWRNTATNAAQADLSNRNQKVAKMVVMISTLFIACFIPITVIFLAVVFRPDISLGGKLVNIGMVASGFAVILEAVNSSTNICIYYYMSSKYRDTFRSIFCNSKLIDKW